MDQTAFLTPAVQCVEALQASSVPPAQMFQDPLNTSLASAISMLTYTAQHIEHTVQQNNNLHNIGILIACRVKADPPPDETFLMWNSITERAKCPQPPTPAPPRSHRRNGRDTDTGSGSEPVHDSVQRPEGDQSVQYDLPSETPCTNEVNLPFAEECSYSVPVGIAAKCLGLLLDGSGFTAHRNIFQKRSYTELGTKPLVDVLKKLFRAENETRTNSNLPRSSATASTKDGMIYCDLLPDHLRNAQENGSILVSVPEVVLEDKGSITIPRYMKVKMNIRKPDRNKKHQNFAVLCALLDHTGPTGICAMTLREYASEGFTAEGCKRRRRYSTSSKSACSGSLSSCEESRRVCSFFIPSETSSIGKGTVDPFVTEIDGKRITEGCISVRITQTRSLEDITFSADLSLEQKTSMYCSWKSGGRLMWPTSGIGRIELLGDYGKPIGTGIFVQKLIEADAHESTMKRIHRSSNGRKNMDVINAIIVCDVVLTNYHLDTTQLYPYMEWYSISYFKPLQQLHFNGQAPPKTLTPAVVRSARALLWNKNHYREEK